MMISKVGSILAMMMLLWSYKSVLWETLQLFLVLICNSLLFKIFHLYTQIPMLVYKYVHEDTIQRRTVTLQHIKNGT